MLIAAAFKPEVGPGPGEVAFPVLSGCLLSPAGLLGGYFIVIYTQKGSLVSRQLCSLQGSEALGL